MMNYVILDLEWNASYSKRYHRFINEIIEFGAVKADKDLNLIDTFSMLVTPQIGKKLNSRISELTHITDEELSDSHTTFTHVLSKFIAFLGDSLLLTWGKGDVLALAENYRYYMRNDKLDFLTSYCDLQVFCQNKLNTGSASHSLGLLSCAEMLNIPAHEEKLHRAYEDAYVSYLCFKEIYDEALLNKLTLTAKNGEFHRWLTFKAKVIYDLKNPLIDKSQMFFDCEKCGRRAVQKTRWIVKNRSFRAKFYCPDCKTKFLGRIVFKQRFNEVTVSKKTVPLIDKNAEGNSVKEKTQGKRGVLESAVENDFIKAGAVLDDSKTPMENMTDVIEKKTTLKQNTNDKNGE